MFLFTWPAHAGLQALFILSWYSVSVLVVLLIAVVVVISVSYNRYLEAPYKASIYEHLSTTFNGWDLSTLGFLCIWPLMLMYALGVLATTKLFPYIGKKLAAKLEARAKNKHPEKFL